MIQCMSRTRRGGGGGGAPIGKEGNARRLA